MKNGPDFIIIGAMKCGTSTLHEQLARQPGIFMTTPKEPSYFSDDEQFARGPEWYASLFTNTAPDELKGESSTHYTKLPTYPETAARMVNALPDAKLVYVIRDPIERLISHYMHAWAEQWLEDPIDRAIESYPPLIAYGQYARQLRPYLDIYGADRIRVVFFERLVREPVYVLSEVASFIGYDNEVQWHYEMARQNASDERLRKSRWRDMLVYAPGLSQVRKTLVPTAVREWGKKFWRMSDRPQPSASSLVALQSIFNEDLAMLGEWFDTSLSCENFTQTALTEDLRWSASMTVDRPTMVQGLT